MLAAFAKKGRLGDVLYYFPHSSKRYEDTIDDIELITRECTTLRGHTHLLSNDQIKPFIKKIVSEVLAKMTYKNEVLEGNSHSRFLSGYFNASFRAFLRPGFLVDARVEVEKIPNIATIEQKMHAIGVRTRTISLHERKYLVIPAVNTREVAEKIRKL